MIDFWQEIWGTIKRNKLRTLLTGFAVMWGIFMLIFLLGSGNGLINAFKKNSSATAINSMSIWGGWTSKAYDGLNKGRPIVLDNKDLSITSGMTNHVEDVCGVVDKSNVTISYKNEYTTSNIKGVSPIYETIQQIEISKGRFINAIDIRNKRKVIVIHESTAKIIFPKLKDPIGQFVEIDNVAYQLIGIHTTKQRGNDTPNFAPLSTIQLIYGKGNDLDNLLFTIKNLPTEKINESFEKEYRAAIAVHERFDKTDSRALWIWNRFSQYLQQEKAGSYLRIALWVIGICTLLSGVVGVSNIMLITVKERTHEFGIRKALGAPPASILFLIIAESITITAIFGYLGMLAGIGATEYMNIVSGAKTVNTGFFEATMFLNPTVDLSVAIQATVTLIVAGTLAGFFPALKAVRISPIEALRSK
ncbi:MAG: ABC transporter permease [Bacteroidaceae bacterium]|nr:ABC transporter permease [Bacteroidaceae bacterium]